MNRLISWLIMVPLAVVVVVFTIANRGEVTLDLWPMPVGINVPIFSLGLVGGVAGFIVGALITWLSGHRRRAQYRKQVRQLEAAKREEAALRERLRHFESSQSTHPPALISAPRNIKADAA